MSTHLAEIMEFATAVLLVTGSFFVFAAAIGMLRMPDIFLRLHAATKAGTLGAALVMAAVALTFAETGVVTRSFAIVVFLMLTAPVAAHLIGRAAYRAGVPLWSGSVRDEWAETAAKELAEHAEAAARTVDDRPEPSPESSPEPTGIPPGSRKE